MQTEALANAVLYAHCLLSNSRWKCLDGRSRPFTSCCFHGAGGRGLCLILSSPREAGCKNELSHRFPCAALSSELETRSSKLGARSYKLGATNSQPQTRSLRLGTRTSGQVISFLVQVAILKEASRHARMRCATEPLVAHGSCSPSCLVREGVRIAEGRLIISIKLQTTIAERAGIKSS